MIAKAVKGKGFRGALEYDLSKEQGRVIDSNMAGENPRELAAEFGEIRKLRPTLGKAVLHVSLSAALGEKLTDEQWREIGKRYMDGMGLEKNQFVITRHNDTEHEHIHILANRIRFNGSVTSDSQDYKRQEVIMREIERDYGLHQVAPSHDAERRAPSKGEVEGGMRTGQPSTRQQLQQLCDAAAKDCRSFTEYQERLEASGVELVPVVQLEGSKLSGLSYRLDGGATMKGSDLGKGYSPSGLAKRGVKYEQDRDFAAVCVSIERDAARTFGDATGDIEASQAPERGGLGRDAGAVGAGAGRTDGRDAPDVGRDRPQEPGAGRDVRAPAIGIGEGLRGRNGKSSISSRELEPSRSTDGMDALRPSRGDGASYSGARERVMALAGTGAESAERAGREGGGRHPETRRDRSVEAIKKQITAMDVQRFEVGIRDAKTGQMMNKDWSREELEQSVGWLKRMNAKANDVYIRPAEEQHGLVLLDDLTPQALERMKADGFAPAATIETSPGNYQAWVKLSDKPLSADVRRIAAHELAKHYDGDMNSADSRHYGRLAGFTNQKPEHTKSGRQPYVLAHECDGKTALDAPNYLEFIEKQIAEEKSREEKARRIKAIKTARNDREKTVQGRKNPPVIEFQMQCQPWLLRYGDKADLSRVDFVAAKAMAQMEYTEKEIADAILQASPNLETRKAGHLEGYATRTARNAVSDPAVIEAVHAVHAAASYDREG